MGYSPFLARNSGYWDEAPVLPMLLGLIDSLDEVKPHLSPVGCMFASNQ